MESDALKKLYGLPELIVYGDIGDLTENINQTGMADNPPGSMGT